MLLSLREHLGRLQISKSGRKEIMLLHRTKTGDPKYAGGQLKVHHFADFSTFATTGQQVFER